MYSSHHSTSALNLREELGEKISQRLNDDRHITIRRIYLNFMANFFVSRLTVRCTRLRSWVRGICSSSRGSARGVVGSEEPKKDGRKRNRVEEMG
jgi:hypothetical protein